MSALPWIAGGIALGGLYLWWKSTSAPAPEEDFCAKACKAAGVFCIDGGASCRGIGGVVAGSGFFSGEVYYGERDRREAINDGLNGAIDIPNPPEGVGSDVKGQGVAPVGTKVLRYKSGCVPLEYSPGWQKCKPGTLDMYASAIDAAAHKNLGVTEKSLVQVGAFISFAERELQGDVWSDSYRWSPINKDHAMTGASGDPATQGPYGDKSAPWWYVRGIKTIGSPGKAPRAVVLQHFNFNGNRDAMIMNLTDDAARELVPIDQDPSIIHTTVIAAPCGTPTPGYSWVVDHWQRTAAGKADVPQPCPKTTATQLVAEAHWISL